MGESRVEGSICNIDGEQTAISLMPGVAGTGSGSLLDSILLKKILYYYILCSVCVCASNSVMSDSL